MESKYFTFLLAFAITISVPLIGYRLFGIIPALIFLCGYLPGFVLWMISDNKTPFENIKVIFWIVLGLFLIHRVEENYTGFFEALSEFTNVPTPEISSLWVFLLVILSIGSWISAPFLIKRGNAFGYLFAWIFLCCCGISELAHFVFPIFNGHGDGYGYFPGMLSVIALAPVSWYAMMILWYRKSYL
ncbi:hypothetical protein [Flavobacterium terrisoli]|uniref:hypothetical protein n=1 Tax=Flavobacterium terrisoli TaxID=3242195 RepID=UPI00254277A5|nr:hypothetical protein [Flavobacterium buctense]